MLFLNVLYKNDKILIHLRLTTKRGSMSKTRIQAGWRMGSLSRATMGVIGCLVICCLITVGVPQARAVEPGPEAAASGPFQVGARIRYYGSIERPGVCRRRSAAKNG